MHECANILRGQPKWLEVSCERLKDGPSVAEHDDRVPASRGQVRRRQLRQHPTSVPQRRAKAGVLQFFCGARLQPARGRIRAVTNFDNVYAALALQVGQRRRGGGERNAGV